MAELPHVLVAGALAGMVEGLTVQPLEMVKTRFQINTGAPLRVGPTIVQLLREGGPLQFYRGALPEIVGIMPRAAAALSTLEFCHRGFRAANANSELSALGAYASGAASGVSEAVAFNPFQVIKVRMMAVEHLGRYTNSMDCLLKVLATEGWGALATGLAPTLWRNCVWNALFYGSVFEIEKRLPAEESTVATLARSAIIGTAVGVAATVFNVPFDVVKSRFQSQLPEARRYHRVWPSLLAIQRAEGWAGLYKGFLPKALRLGIGQTVGLLTFQQCCRLVGSAGGGGADKVAADAAGGAAAADVAEASRM